jgi:hypothetical protein
VKWLGDWRGALKSMAACTLGKGHPLGQTSHGWQEPSGMQIVLAGHCVVLLQATQTVPSQTGVVSLQSGHFATPLQAPLVQMPEQQVKAVSALQADPLGKQAQTFLPAASVEVDCWQQRLQLSFLACLPRGFLLGQRCPVGMHASLYASSRCTLRRAVLA